MSWRNMSRHVICHDINYIYFDSTLMFTIHIIMLNSSSKTLTTIRITLFMIFIFYSYLSIYYIITSEAVCIIRGYLCNNIKQVTSYHIRILCHDMSYVTTITASLFPILPMLIIKLEKTVIITNRLWESPPRETLSIVSSRQGSYNYTCISTWVSS